ncbi:MAG: MOSC domain-containing protein [Alphaproteobacteria bacterium]|nr:MOSC domain-containing protein [Alphaproteobacteria bacterium]
MAGNGIYFGNIEDRVISLINQASVADFERTISGPVDPRRFRSNFYIDGIAPWAERHWVGKTVKLGDVRFEVVDETIRCGATIVDPASGARNLNVPKLLQEHYGHMFCGVYLKALESGTVSEGADITVSAS